MAVRGTVNVYTLSNQAMLWSAGPNVNFVTLSQTFGNTMVNNGATFLYVSNTAGSTTTLTISYPILIDTTQAVAARTYALPASTPAIMIGLFPQSLFGGNLLINVSANNAVNAMGVSLI